MRKLDPSHTQTYGRIVDTSELWEFLPFFPLDLPSLSGFNLKVKSQGVVKHSQKESKIKQRLKHVPLDALLQQGNQRLRMRLCLMNQRNFIGSPTHQSHTQKHKYDTKERP